MTDVQLIQAAIDRFIAAYNAGDLAGILGCYDSGLIKLRQGAPAESREQTERRLSQSMADYRGQLQVRNDEFLVSGNLAVVRGELRLELSPRAGGESVSLQRRFLEIWRKTDGEWLVYRTMDNSDRP
jgi:ketosteroid isomerase-like protein